MQNFMHAIFDLLYKLPSQCHFRQLSVSSFDLLCTGQSTKAKFEHIISAFHYFLFSSSHVFVKQSYNTTKGHYKFIEKSCFYIPYTCGSPIQNISWCMQCLEMNCFSTSIVNTNKWTTSIFPHLLTQIRPCQMINQSVLPYCPQPCAILSASLLVSSRLWRKFTWHENQHIFVSTQHRYTQARLPPKPVAIQPLSSLKNLVLIIIHTSKAIHHTILSFPD